MENERNEFTGTIMNKRDNTVHNPLTGDYRKVDDSDDESVCKSRSLWPSISKQADDNESDDEEIEKVIPIFPVEKKGDERICCGIVYQPDTVDSQGDKANAEEIRKAAYHFMENVQTFKVMHKGRPAKIKVLESYIAPQDLTISKRKIKKGSWVLVTRVLDDKLWSAIKSGKYTGYSMAGYAKVESDEQEN